MRILMLLLFSISSLFAANHKHPAHAYQAKRNRVGHKSPRHAARNRKVAARRHR